MWEATAARARVGRFKRGAAARVAAATADEHRVTENAMHRRWGGVPETTKGILSWAEAAAQAQAATVPRMVAANRDAEHARGEPQRLAEQRAEERAALHGRIFEKLPPGGAEGRAAQWLTRAGQARRDLGEIEALPVTQAAQLIRDRAARVQAKRATAERAQAARDAQAAKLGQFRTASNEHQPRGPDHGIGPKL